MVDGSEAQKAAAKIKLGNEKDWKKIILVVCFVMVAVFVLVGIVAQLNPEMIPIGKYREVDVIDPETNEPIVDEITGEKEKKIDYSHATRPPIIDGAVLAALAFLGPYGFYISAQMGKIKKIEIYLPDFLRDVAEAGRFGMTLSEAIVVASNGKYGMLTPEIKKMAAQIQWGVPASEALRLFGDRIDTALVHRTVAIVTKSSDAGGSVADVLSMVAHNVKEEQLAEAEKKIQMVTYLAVIYIAYMVFLVTILIMSGTFLPAMTEAGASIGQMDTGEGEDAPAMINVAVIEKLDLLFFAAAIIHGAGDGLVAGILESGRIVSGLKHSFLLLMIGYVMLGVM